MPKEYKIIKFIHSQAEFHEQQINKFSSVGYVIEFFVKDTIILSREVKKKDTDRAS